MPANTSALSADGNIVASDSIKLNFGSAATGGTILNTGTISSSGSLTVNTGTLTNEANQVNVGQIWSKVKGGYVDTTGTVVQPGGFMSAANMDLNVQTLKQIGGALQQLNADGTVDQAGTQQMLAALEQQLGSGFTQTTLSDHLHTDFVKAGGGLPMVVVAVIAIAASIITAGAAAAAFGVVMTQLSIGSVLIGALGGMVGSAVSQVASGQDFSLGQMLKAGAIGALSAGAMGALHLADLSSLHTLGSEIANGTVQMADVGNALVTIGERGLVTASVDTAVEGGSFGRAFEGSVIGDLGAVGASAIGAKAGDENSWLAEKTPGNVLAHAALGCALSAADGTGCAGGAIGAGASAIVAPYLVQQAGGLGNLTDGQRSAIVGVSTLLGGLASGVAGQNAVAGANAATNESLNNSTNPEDIVHGRDLIPLEGGGGGPGGDIIPDEPPVLGGGYATPAPSVSAAVQSAAQNLGVDPNVITVDSSGVARVTIGVTNSMSFSDVQTLVNYADSLGATSVEVNSGYLANPKLDALLQNFVQSGRPLYGGTVKFNPSGTGDYTITFPVRKK